MERSLTMRSSWLARQPAVTGTEKNMSISKRIAFLLLLGAFLALVSFLHLSFEENRKIWLEKTAEYDQNLHNLALSIKNKKHQEVLQSMIGKKLDTNSYRSMVAWLYLDKIYSEDGEDAMYRHFLYAVKILGKKGVHRGAIIEALEVLSELDDEELSKIGMEGNRATYQSLHRFAIREKKLYDFCNTEEAPKCTYSFPSLDR